MKRNYPLKISQVIEELFRDNDMEETVLMHRALAAWSVVVGPVVNRQTVERRVAAGVICVRIASAVVRQELSMQRTALISALNHAVGADVIKEIKFV